MRYEAVGRRHDAGGRMQETGGRKSLLQPQCLRQEKPAALLSRPTLPLHKMMMMRGGTTVATVALFLLMKAPHQELMAPYYC